MWSRCSKEGDDGVCATLLGVFEPREDLVDTWRQQAREFRKLAPTAPEDEAFEIERNFAGSAQLDYLSVPTAPQNRKSTLDGFTTELSIKLESEDEMIV